MLVGVENYQDPDFDDLKFPIADISILSDVLKKQGMFKSIQTLENPTHDLLKEELFEFFRGTSDLKPQTLLFYFSGHGYRSYIEQSFYFIASNSKKSKLQISAVDGGFFNKLILNTPARRVIIILDCCYSGEIMKGLTPRSSTDHAKSTVNDFLEALESKKHSTALLTSSTSSQLSFEPTEDHPIHNRFSIQHSFFTAALIDGILDGKADYDGDGFIDINEIDSYIKSKFAEWGITGQDPQLSHIYSHEQGWIATTPAKKYIFHSQGSSGKILFVLTSQDVLDIEVDAMYYPTDSYGSIGMVGQKMHKHDPPVIDELRKKSIGGIKVGEVLEVKSNSLNVKYIFYTNITPAPLPRFDDIIQKEGLFDAARESRTPTKEERDRRDKAFKIMKEDVRKANDKFSKGISTSISKLIAVLPNKSIQSIVIITLNIEHLGYDLTDYLRALLKAITFEIDGLISAKLKKIYIYVETEDDFTTSFNVLKDHLMGPINFLSELIPLLRQLLRNLRLRLIRPSKNTIANYLGDPSFFSSSAAKGQEKSILDFFNTSDTHDVIYLKSKYTYPKQLRGYRMYGYHDHEEPKYQYFEPDVNKELIIQLTHITNYNDVRIKGIQSLFYRLNFSEHVRKQHIISDTLYSNLLERNDKVFDEWVEELLESEIIKKLKNQFE